MLVQIICVLILASAMLAHDIPKFSLASVRDRVVYGVLLLPVLYLGFIFIAAKPWPNLDSLFNQLTGPAEHIVHWINPAIS
ncbi:hypothetical protein MHB77_09515 [Paenibacillus sp. FSL K6-3166]|uniref:hypothetical protein n=1 Tax=unclassified Paenibacillus TaxID=185978 RepID=UPI000BA14157|nr:hypothetical protein [Paenibacillus sp. VTT E-133291]OZQ94997.1 hypothetical protein CA598_08635 [Paenibacillus sp. VTT E-133291]